MAVNTYLIDAFTLYAASAIAANTILRSVRITYRVLYVWGLSLTSAVSNNRSSEPYSPCLDCKCTMRLVW
jgi:hypothetical protein